MILQSLVRYYEVLAADPACTIARFGWCSVNVSFAAVLSPEGTLLDFYSLKLQQPRRKKLVEVPQNLIVPEQAKRSVGIFPYFLCENSSYMFGIDGKGSLQRSLKCFQAFKTLHEKILAEIESPEAKAILSFLNSWKPEEMTEHPLILAYQKELFKGANLVFRIDGGRYAHEVPEIRHAWEKYYESIPGIPVAQCLVSGERRPIARLHPAFRGIQGGQSTGVSIVSFNASAYESYGHETWRKQGDGQGLNAPVSEYAAFAYGTALKKLLADRTHVLSLGDMTVVYWAENASPLYQDIFQFSVDPPDEKTGADAAEEDIETREIIRDIFLKISEGRAVDTNLAFDTSVHFCILGLSPNAARLSIRFFLRDTFGEILKRLAQHHLNMRIEHASFEPDFFSLWRLLNQTVSPNSTDKSASPLLSGSVLRAILSGTEYPESLYNSVLLRIRAEHEVNYYKAAILKGCLLKKSEKQYIHQEVLTVSLNESCDYKPYVLGRLFSVLEQLQTDAIPGINSTIRDRYFTSASASPGTVFPTLLRLSNHHITKSHRGKSFSEKIQELMNMLPMDGEPFPAQFSSYDQGIFILGYYHQNKCN